MIDTDAMCAGLSDGPWDCTPFGCYVGVDHPGGAVCSIHPVFSLADATRIGKFIADARTLVPALNARVHLLERLIDDSRACAADVTIEQWHAYLRDHGWSVIDDEWRKGVYAMDDAPSWVSLNSLAFVECRTHRRVLLDVLDPSESP